MLLFFFANNLLFFLLFFSIYFVLLSFILLLCYTLNPFILGFVYLFVVLQLFFFSLLFCCYSVRVTNEFNPITMNHISNSMNTMCLHDVYSSPFPLFCFVSFYFVSFFLCPLVSNRFNFGIVYTKCDSLSVTMNNPQPELIVFCFFCCFTLFYIRLVIAY